MHCGQGKSMLLPADWQDWQEHRQAECFPHRNYTSRQAHRFPQPTHRTFCKLCSTSHLSSVQGTFSWCSPFKFLTDGQKYFHTQWFHDFKRVRKRRKEENGKSFSYFLLFSLFRNHEIRVCESLSAHLSETQSDSVPSTPPQVQQHFHWQ